MRYLLIGLLVFVTCFGAIPVSAQYLPEDARFEVEAISQYFNPNGTVIAGGGSEIDVESDLKVGGDRDLVIGARYQPANGQGVRGRWGKFEFHGHTTLDESTTYGETTFSGGTDVSTNMDVQFIDLDTLYDLTQTGYRDFFNLSAGARLIGYDGRVSGGGQSAREEMTTFSPVVGVDFRQYLWPEGAVSGRISGMDITMDENDFKLVDGEAGLSVNVHEDLWVQGGYRIFLLDSNQDEDQIDLDFEGFSGSIKYYF